MTRVDKGPNRARHLDVLTGAFWALLRKPRNQKTYSRADVVADYSEESELFPPELVALDLMHKLTPDASVLDIGVGGGRTTAAFSGQARLYVGVDYAPAMVSACKRRFAGFANPLNFCISDVRDLPFKDGSFDFVLFSFNGIDYMDLDNRLKALREIRRVCGTDGIFCFSTHNIWSLSHRYDELMCDRKGIYRKLTGLLNRALFRAVNPKAREMLGRGHAMVNDGAHNFGLRTYYADPNETLSQLVDVGFNSLRAYDLSGQAIGQPVSRSCTDVWLTYLCTRTLG